MTGIEMLEQVRRDTPGHQAAAAHGVRRHRRGDPGDQRDRARLLLFKPWDPPEERLYPVVDDLLEDWRQENPEPLAAAGHRPPLVRAQPRGQDLPRPATTCPTGGSTSSATRRPPASSSSRRRGPPTCRWCWCPTARPSARPPTPAGRRPRAAHPRRAAALRPVHRRQRPGRSRRRRLRRVRGAEHRRRRARRPRRPGGPERVDRELPRLPQGALRGRPHPSRRRPGRRVSAPRRSSPGSRRVRDPRPGAGGPPRRGRGDRGARAAGRHRCLLPPAGGAGV